MSDKALDNAKALKIKALSEIERLEDEARVWRDRIAMADQFIDQWNAFASGEAVNPVGSVSVEQNKQAPSTAKRNVIRNSKKEDVAAAALEVIRDRGEPVSRTDLFKALIDRGLTIEGSDPEMVLSTMLWRMREKIVRFKNGGYWDARSDWEPAGYKSEWLDEIEGRERDYSGVDLAGNLIE
ncbi:hypothetical protein NKH69_09975 [Mesorhizobium sp. M0976]|uniref:hypothetical protein n=1 Tax=unclassified Mesorhizobium TaxID=325217 RepID=UPI00333E01BD